MKGILVSVILIVVIVFSEKQNSSNSTKQNSSSDDGNGIWYLLGGVGLASAGFWAKDKIKK